MQRHWPLPPLVWAVVLPIKSTRPICTRSSCVKNAKHVARALRPLPNRSIKSVLFVTELLQSLGNGHANRRAPRPNRFQPRINTAERSGTSETDGKAARVAVEFRTEIPSNGHGLYLRVSYFCSHFAACRAEAAKAGAKRSTERHGAPALPIGQRLQLRVIKHRFDRSQCGEAVSGCNRSGISSARRAPVRLRSRLRSTSAWRAGQAVTRANCSG